MDSTGCWRDNVFFERLWRSVMYEEVYLRAQLNFSDGTANYMGVPWVYVD